jgi:putative membrane protein
MLIVSGINPYERSTWFLEIAPVLIAIPILIYTYNKFRLTDLAYTLIWIHCIILMVGGHYTYAKVPLFDYIRDYFGLMRNYYDRLGHIAQGFIPAIVIRELLIRKTPLRTGGWLFTIVVFMCLGFSALYELIEFLAAKVLGEGAEAFLGTQGDIWDTQWDMTCALIGSITSLLIFTKYHDRLIKNLGFRP